MHVEGILLTMSQHLGSLGFEVGVGSLGFEVGVFPDGISAVTPGVEHWQPRKLSSSSIGTTRCSPQALLKMLPGFEDITDLPKPLHEGYD